MLRNCKIKNISKRINYCWGWEHKYTNEKLHKVSVNDCEILVPFLFLFLISLVSPYGPSGMWMNCYSTILITTVGLVGIRTLEVALRSHSHWGTKPAKDFFGKSYLTIVFRYLHFQREPCWMDENLIWSENYRSNLSMIWKVLYIFLN